MDHCARLALDPGRIPRSVNTFNAASHANPGIRRNAGIDIPGSLGQSCFLRAALSNLCVIAERSDDRKQMIVTGFDPLKGRVRELARFDVDPALDVNVENLICVLSPDGTRLATASGPNGPIKIYSLRITVSPPFLQRGWTDYGM